MHIHRKRHLLCFLLLHPLLPLVFLVLVPRHSCPQHE
jgi:hypothetical protein